MLAYQSRRGAPARDPKQHEYAVRRLSAARLNGLKEPGHPAWSRQIAHATRFGPPENRDGQKHDPCENRGERYSRRAGMKGNMAARAMTETAEQHRDDGFSNIELRHA